MDATDYLHGLIAEGEHLHQDFKFAISDARKIARSLSAFANTGGGRLLVGVKDNGRIAGVRSEEEMYMIEAAASLYCRPAAEIHTYIYKVEGKDVLVVEILEHAVKPVCAVDEEGKAWAYVRVADENILANAVHLNIWKHERQETEVVMTYTEQEQRLLDVLGQRGALSLNQCAKVMGTDRRSLCQLLADFIRFGLVEQVFTGHRFHYRLRTSATDLPPDEP